MIIDDSVQNPRKKRECLLNPNYKYIGICASDYINNNENNIIINTKGDNNDNIVDKNKEENERNNGGNIYNNNEVIIKEEKININIKNEGKKKAFCAYFTLK